MPLPEPTFASYQDTKVAYYSYGTGPEALVFIHGWTCDSALWEPQQPLFQKYRTVLVDSPGHGNSDAPVVEYSTEYLARGIKAALDAAGIKRAVLVGHSMGGPKSTMLLRLFPELVKAILYVDSGLAYPEQYMNHVELAEIARQRADDDNFRGMIEWMQAKGDKEVLQTVLRRMLSTPKHVRVSCVSTREHPHAWRWDEVYDIPALHIGTVFVFGSNEYWKHHIPRLEVDAWTECAHFPFMEQPERFNERVVKFIEDNRLL